MVLSAARTTISILAELVTSVMRSHSDPTVTKATTVHWSLVHTSYRLVACERTCHLHKPLVLAEVVSSVQPLTLTP
jgi:hypothetical protein